MLYNSNLYFEELEKCCNYDLDWEKLKNKSFLISGSTGLIGSFLIDLLLYKNIGCKIYAITRNTEKAKKRFSFWNGNNHLIFIEHNIVNKFDYYFYPDYILHLASNTHPRQYSSDPINTILINILGLNNLLDWAKDKTVKKFIFASSTEIYGENRGDTELFDEDYCGYINSNTLRAGYNESKRCGESLCQAYIEKYNMDIIIPRFARIYGPTSLSGDSKVINQFIDNCLNNKDIILKSEGNQNYSFLYVVDAVMALISILLNGEKGNAYNISDINSNIKLKDLANLIANKNNLKVIFDLPDEVERKGYSTSTVSLLDNTKLLNLGWKPIYNIEEGIANTIEILKESK